MRNLGVSADPFGEPVRPGRLLALMEDDAAAPRRGWWVSKEDGDAVQLKVPMPGLGKEHVKVWADQDGLVIAGEDTGDDDEEEGPARYSGCIALSWDAFKMDQIKAEMKDGVLKVTVPKIKVEDRKDVFQVKVE